MTEAEAEAQVLNDDEVRTIADIAVRSERHSGCPQDTEWAIAGGKTYIVQTRPITTLHRVGKPVPETHEVLLQGLPAVPGEASGVVRVLADVKDGARLQDGEVLVAQMTNPDWLPTMRRASALVTDSGGMTCHAAIVARELGVPCIVGARTATKDLKDGTVVTVDGPDEINIAHELVEMLFWDHGDDEVHPLVRGRLHHRVVEIARARIALLAGFFPLT